MLESKEETFVVDLLTTIRRDRYSPRGWGRFLQRSWQMSCQTAEEHPGLTCSWRHVTWFIGLLALCILVGDVLLAGLSDGLRLLPGFVFCVAWQQSDLFWHLGLNRSVQSGEILPRVGVANTLTWLRGLAACYLIGRLIGGLTVPSELALSIFLCGIVTDILDGQFARRSATQSRLGQIADGETDFCLYLALTLILLQNGVLPLWVGVVMLLRFVVPLVAALLSYLAFARPVRFGSTVWGRYAGGAQCLYFLLVLLPHPLAHLLHFLHIPLLIIMVCLLVIAPVMQITLNLLAMRRK